jgi:hypothetical protein
MSVSVQERLREAAVYLERFAADSTAAVQGAALAREAAELIDQQDEAIAQAIARLRAFSDRMDELEERVRR